MKYFTPYFAPQKWGTFSPRKNSPQFPNNSRSANYGQSGRGVVASSVVAGPRRLGANPHATREVDARLQLDVRVSARARGSSLLLRQCRARRRGASVSDRRARALFKKNTRRTDSRGVQKRCATRFFGSGGAFLVR